ncbi:hypothetical protein KCM76_17175 [Zooshikella marina]|uniref:DUF6896 domain-containing protein n=1 Tax=Zooshikella ganghwensis TaxID=202772 RepID=UPI001BAF6801|nr:hypothetical protein [Zooshikella ganghwensis]MBU2707728.1 hypothetical protein [Zooshikella ganghwensis]
MNKLVNQIKIFISLQRELWDKLTQEVDFDFDPFLLNAPKQGSVTLNNKWKYSKHGLGFRFTEEITGTVIDFHTVKAGADCFDEWGLETYFNSLGVKGRKLLQDNYVNNKVLDIKLKHQLDLLVQEGILEKNEKFYKLV